MTATPASPAASQQAAVDAALLIVERMGLSPDDLTAAPRQRPAVPSFANYVPVVSAAVTDGTRRAYGTYWNRITEQWGTRRLDEPTPSEVRQLMKLIKAGAVQRRNGRGGRSAEEHLVAALRCLYRHAEDDGLISEKDNPARKVDKPRRLPSTRRAVADTRLAEINQVAATTGDDPELDTLILRLHTDHRTRRQVTHLDQQPGARRLVSAVPEPGRRRVPAGPAHQQQPPGLHERAELPAQQEPRACRPHGEHERKVE